MRTRTLTKNSKSGSTTKSAANKEAAPNGNASSDLHSAIIGCLEDAKAEDIISLDLDAQAALADQMIIATGRSNRHVSAITDQLLDELKAQGRKDLRVEGLPHCDWVLVDAGDIIVHVFRPEVRTFYNLEKLWSPHAPAEASAGQQKR